MDNGLFVIFHPFFILSESKFIIATFIETMSLIKLEKIMSRPDVSFYLAHFTSNKFPKGYKNDGNPTNEYMRTPAIKRLENILREKKIIASVLPWSGKKAVCLTECPWTSLVEHTKQYSSYGIGFNKKFIYCSRWRPCLLCQSRLFRSSTMEW